MKTRTVREVLAAAVLALVVGVPALVTTLHAQQPAQGKQGFPDLVGLLKATPGVIGVDAARTMSGKQVIFAWFENKKAVLNWYYSDAHQALMLQLAGSMRRPGGPLADVPDDGRPVLAIASLTMPSSAAPPGPSPSRGLRSPSLSAARRTAWPWATSTATVILIYW